MKPKIFLHSGDLPSDVVFQGSIAIDTEAMGLNPHRDRLCLVQISSGNGECHLVKFDGVYDAPRLKKVLNDASILKIFHFARFDVAILQHYLNAQMSNIYCTKIASKLARTFTDKHSLRDLCRDLIGVDVSKEQQTSDWGAPTLKIEQQEYAATDVLHLHKLKDKLDLMLVRENKVDLAQSCFEFIPTCTQLDLMGHDDLNIFKH
jgi:ribonuclease D